MADLDLLTLITRFRKKALVCRSRHMRIQYSSEDRRAAVAFVQDCWTNNLSVYDASEILSLHMATLESWLEKATRPGIGDNLYRVFDTVNGDAPNGKN